MSLSIAELKKTSVQSIRDIAVGLRAKAASMRATKAGVSDLPHKGTWTGVAADNADHEIGTFATATGNAADTYENAAKKVDLAGDEFEGLKQLLDKLENEAAGKFSINETTGEVTPLTKDFNKADRDYIASTLKQLCAAGGQANDDLAAAIHATDGTTTPASTNPAGAVQVPAAKDEPSLAARLKGLAPPNPDGDPGATKAAAATATETEARYKEWYPKNDVSVGDKKVDPYKLGGVGSLPGVRDGTDKTPARMSPTLQPKDVPAFKDMTRQVLQHQGVPADQIEARVNKAVEQAQTPHFLPDAPALGDGNADLSKSPGDRFIDFTNNVHEGFYQSADGAVEQGKQLTGQAGPGAPGVAEAWANLAKDSGKSLFEQTVNPIGSAIDQAQQAVNDPGHFAGHKLFEATAIAPTLPLGGEGGALAHGLEGGIERGLAGDLTHAPHIEPPSGGGHVGGDHGDFSGVHSGAGTGDIGVGHDLPHIDMNMKDNWSEFQQSQMQHKIEQFNKAVGDQGFSQTPPGVRDPAIRQLFLDTLGLDRVPPGFHVDHTRDLQAGGFDAVDNMGLLDGSVNMSFGSQLNAGMNQFPPGTIFGGVRPPVP
ncbi:hypothetical protein [Mycobacteroides abscessus]|uniref:hypothetical protein n=1 Tax=Mycobacteroides abscessus TaxID=36809 RepID=UPI001F297E10|nr:hypothetical protein [Mycobacteroides abscessus]